MNESNFATDNTFEALKGRFPIGWLRERDIDLLLCAELHVEGGFRRYLARQLGIENGTLDGAWVSHNDLDGESDLVVGFCDRDERLIALIENKIAANFQPEQVNRYRARATRWQASTPHTRVVTVLIAPLEYLGREGSDGFDIQLAYEHLAESLLDLPDPRSVFLAKALSAGIEVYRQGYTAVPNKSVTDVWTAIWRVASSEVPQLNMERPTPKPSRSSFIYFLRPQGFSRNDLRHVKLVLKGSHGFVDLQFGQTAPEDLERSVGHLLEDGMTIARAAGSASIRISIPRLDFGGQTESQIAKIRTGIMQAERLRVFFNEKQPLRILKETS